MAQLVLSIVGYGVGRQFGAPGLGTWIGYTIGSYIDRKWLFPPDPSEGPRLDDLKIQISTYGAPINQLWGTMRMAGNVIWAAPIREVAKVEGGGGCGGGPSIETTVYTYLGTFAIGICRGPISNILRIWADTKLIYSVREENDEVVAIDGFNFKIYQGTSIQTADPWIESFEGIGEVPGFRDLAYIVMNDFPLEKFGNRIPNFTFEVATNTSTPVPAIPIDEIEATVWGSDHVIMYPDNIHALVQASGRWNLINMITSSVVVQKEYLRPNPGDPDNRDADLPSIADTSDFAIDENNLIYTTKWETGTTSRIVILDGRTLEIVLSTGFIVFTPFEIASSKNGLHPYVCWINYQGNICITTRIQLWERDAADISVVLKPTGLNFKSMWMDDKNGVLWAVASEWISPTTTKVIRIVLGPGVTYGFIFDISSRVTGGEEICYDKDSNQILIGTSYQNGSEDYVFFFVYDVSESELTYIAEVGPTAFGPWPKSFWNQGIVNGYLYFTWTGEVKRIDVSMHTIDRTWTPDNNCLFYGGGVYHSVTHSVLTGVTGCLTEWEKVLLDRANDSSEKLSDVVTEICDQVDIPGAMLDVTALTDDVRGYVLNTRMRARAALTPLIDGFFFDGIESDGKLKFPKRGGSSIVAIPESDLAAHLTGNERPQKLISFRQQEVELPIQVEVVYVDGTADYVVGTQRARRLTKASREKMVVRLPIHFNADEALQIAVKHLLYAWLQRTRHVVTVPRKYSYLDPGDVVTVTEDGNLHTVRIDQLDYSNGILNLNLVNEDASAYASDAFGSALAIPEQKVDYPGPTTLVILDIPILRDKHNTPGMYVAVLGVLDTWAGARVYMSSDSGATWQEWATCNKDAAIGTATNALADVADPFVWDEGNTLNIRMLDTADSLTTATEAQVLDGANAGVLGDEIIQWKNVVAESDGTYTISGLVRGRKGTEWATGTHSVGDIFVVLDEDRIHFVEFPAAELDTSKLFRAVSFGLLFINGVNQTKTIALRNMMPLSPQHVAGTRDGSNDLTVAWIRRGRVLNEWRDGLGTPLGEADEAYEIDVYDGVSVVRTIATSSETAVYTAAQQTADGLTPGDPVTLIVYQISEIVGRGFGTQETV